MGRKTHPLTLIKDTGITKITLEEITKEESSERYLLGTGSGHNISYCAYLGARHCTTKDFMEKVKYYRLLSDEELDDMARKFVVTVAFYK